MAQNGLQLFRQNGFQIIGKDVDRSVLKHQLELIQKLWRSYQKKYSYAADLDWDTVMDSVTALYNKAATEQ